MTRNIETGYHTAAATQKHKLAVNHREAARRLLAGGDILGSSRAMAQAHEHELHRDRHEHLAGAPINRQGITHDEVGVSAAINRHGTRGHKGPLSEVYSAGKSLFAEARRTGGM